MNTSNLFIIKFIMTCLVLMVLMSCNPIVLDDFFGIQMDPEYVDSFEIVSYSKNGGAKYKSNLYMNPSVYAYAEFGPNSISIKIVNYDTNPLNVNYNFDEFFMYTENEKFVLSKGDRENYPKPKEIKTGESAQFNLELPTNFIEKAGMKDPQSHTANYTIAFWKGENTLNIRKEKVKYIEVLLGTDIVIMLKPIPNKTNKK